MTSPPHCVPRAKLIAPRKSLTNQTLSKKRTETRSLSLCGGATNERRAEARPRLNQGSGRIDCESDSQRARYRLRGSCGGPPATDARRLKNYLQFERKT